MKAVGIIAEYNPLHNGHVYHIEESKRKTKADIAVVAMSGDFVQRGEPAILDKWERAGLAIAHGVDVVVEIPTYFCLGNARQYGATGVYLLESIGGVNTLSFGSETGDIEALSRVAQNLTKRKHDIQISIKALTKLGFSYPNARQTAYASLFAYEEPTEDEIRELSVLNGSNDILALEYIMACEKIHPMPILRAGAGYSDKIDELHVFQSATGIREYLLNKEDVSPYVPEDVSYILDSRHLSFTNEWSDILRYSVLSLSAEDIDKYPSGGEGIGNRLRKAALENEKFDEIVSAVKTKRYTRTRISRLCMQIILGIKMKTYSGIIPSYIRILGLSENGRKFISHVKKNELNTLPIVTNINKEMEVVGEEMNKLSELDVHSADIYNLITGKDMLKNSDHRVTPIIR